MSMHGMQQLRQFGRGVLSGSRHAIDGLWVSVLLSDGDDDFAASVAGFDVGDRLGPFAEVV
jgi:hypothetical protein